MTPFRVWAPRAESVSLEVGSDSHDMRSASQGWWVAPVHAAAGDRYAYRLDGGDERPDPRSLSQPDGPHDRSAVVDLAAHHWTDGSWAGAPLQDAVIYELHLGTFTPDGTCDAAIERLDHLFQLGITMVELMPVAAFPGDRGWGYDGVNPYAVHAAYGGAAALQRLVDACHRKGIGVCLDVVYNHLGPSGNYLSEFGPYFTDRYSTPWGWAVNLDGPHSDEVRAYLIDNARMWFRDFHLDALRLDAVHALFDDRATTILEELAVETDRLSDELGRPLALIAESDRNDPATVTRRAPSGHGGLGLHAQWADDVHHSLHVLLTGESQGYYADFAAGPSIVKTLSTPFFHDGTWSSFRQRHHGRAINPATTRGWRFVASLQTHDQVGNRASGDRLSQLVSPGRLACGAAILLTSPYVPMLFMGEEWGASTPWQYFTDHQDPELARAVSQGRRDEFATHGWGDDVPDPQAPSTLAQSQLRWDEVEIGTHRELLAWYRTLIHLRHNVSDLREGTLGGAPADLCNGRLTVRRGRWTVVANLSNESFSQALAAGDAVHAGWSTYEGASVVTLPPDSVMVVGPRDLGATA
ncbi:malto-oligosyltrehalose trehalohydrolase [Leekyejoonella antrihumi]|uniref:Malto-oligosyltrehalose trehalohydrolase n=1 Tax=Leekyejoonella antrihumi TaxID=1660198 RepID=A0A563E8N5_9MICO|nr:malto-oligosyltrehalose trehalohydrolase [Leekyejoonella antrihumi]TWP38938.1 malto-oligosyltrehalose trehalohydrolase [Leekyejoonella antrihumi]